MGDAKGVLLKKLHINNCLKPKTIMSYPSCVEPDVSADIITNTSSDECKDVSVNTNADMEECIDSSLECYETTAETTAEEDDNNKIYETLFNARPVTTITMILLHSRKIDYHAAYNFLPVIRNVTIQPFKDTAIAYEIFFRGIPGSIYSLRDPELGDRGIIYTRKRPFKNCTTVKLESEKSIYTMKIYASCLHITGIYCVEDAIECQNYLLYYLNLIEYTRRYVRTAAGLETVRWVLEATKGPWNPPANDYMTILPRVIPLEYNGHPIDVAAAYLLLSYEYGNPYYSSYVSKLRFFVECQWNLFMDEGDHYVTSGGFRTHMINYNYRLDFDVDCQSFSRYVDGYEKLSCCPIIKNPNRLKIELQHDCYIEDKKRRKKRVPHHTLIVNRSGAIAQSSPTFEEAKKLFIIFMRIISYYKGYMGIP